MTIDYTYGTLLDDVVQSNGWVDGVELGGTGEVHAFQVTSSHFLDNRRFGVGALNGAGDGVVADSSIERSGGGGLDIEGDSAGPVRNLAFRKLLLVGLGDPSVDDYGIQLLLTIGDVKNPNDNRNIAFDGIHLQDFFFGMYMTGGGVYDEVSFRGEMRDVRNTCFFRDNGVGPLGVRRMTLEGTFVNCGGTVNHVIDIEQEQAQGWSIGPLQIRQSPAWSNGSVIFLRDVPPGAGLSIHDANAYLFCQAGATGCDASNFVAAENGGVLARYHGAPGEVPHLPVLVTHSAMHYCPADGPVCANAPP